MIGCLSRRALSEHTPSKHIEKKRSSRARVGHRMNEIDCRGSDVERILRRTFSPEGERTEAGEIHPLQPGVGLIASRLRVPIVPIRLRGVEKILHRGQHFPRPGPVEVAFGQALYLSREDYPAMAKQVDKSSKPSESSDLTLRCKSVARSGQYFVAARLSPRTPAWR
jgi:hypothetical protein